MHAWIFGYGSLIWRPDIPYEDRRPARLAGWQRRFWQGSHDHRGMPDSPGRVVTLVSARDAYCDGVAYRVTPEVVAEVFETLDYREKNGYQRYEVELEFRDRPERTRGLVYIAPEHNHAYLGPAPLPAMAQQIRASVGPSGRNMDYLLELARALRDIEADDPHVFELERAVLEEKR